MPSTLSPLELHPAANRGHANFGWLNAKHSFSFGNHFDPAQQGFSDLLVINDDLIHAGGGFQTHPHRDMEIFTYILQGELEHKDSMGTGSVIRPGDVQMMSAGSGVRHSEFNPSPSNLTRLLQIWIVPNQKNVTPRYQQIYFDEAEKRGKLRLIISPSGIEGSLSVHQDAAVYAGLFNGSESAEYLVKEKRYAYLQIAQGEITVNGQHMLKGDGARIRDPGLLKFSKAKNAEVLLFDLRPNELPQML